LDYHPDLRAYLGLAILKQKQGNFNASIQIAWEGIRHFPANKDLNMCVGISHMNRGDYDQALSRFSRFQNLEEVQPYITECHRKLEK
jgi:hypothetical protein